MEADLATLQVDMEDSAVEAVIRQADMAVSEEDTLQEDTEVDQATL